MTVENHIGKITITKKYLRDLISYTATNCFGVASMDDCNPLAPLWAFIAPKKGVGKNKGVFIQTKDNNLKIDLHIAVAYGVNVSAITKSIVNKVRFAVERAINIKANEINVYIDNIDS